VKEIENVFGSSSLGIEVQDFIKVEEIVSLLEHPLGSACEILGRDAPRRLMPDLDALVVLVQLIRKEPLHEMFDHNERMLKLFAGLISLLDELVGLFPEKDDLVVSDAAVDDQPLQLVVAVAHAKRHVAPEQAPQRVDCPAPHLVGVLDFVDDLVEMHFPVNSGQENCLGLVELDCL
jgi:hypothetical protein